MEDSPAKGLLDTRGSSLEMVNEADALIGIIGYRYGARAPPENRSLTELEWLRAGERGIPRCFLLMSPSYSVPRSLVEGLSTEDKASLESFRQQVRGTRVWAEFDNAHEFSVKAAALLVRLRRDLEELLPSSERAAGYRWPTVLDFDGYMADKRGRLFQGRQWLFQKIDQWVDSTEEPALLICSEFGVGKSALLAEYVRTHRDRRVVAWHFCQRDTAETLRPGSFVRSLAARLAQRFPEYRERIEGSPELQMLLAEADVDPVSALQVAVLEPLHQVPAPGYVRVFVIDALNEALETEADSTGVPLTLVDLLARKAKSFPRWLRLLATSRQNPEVQGRLQAVFTLWNVGAEAGENKKDLQQYVLGQATADICRRAGLSPEALTGRLVEKSGGKFLFVVQALRELSSGKLSLDQLLALPPGMDPFYLDAFERCFGVGARNYPEARDLLGVMCAASEPLPPAVLAVILGVSEDSIERIRSRLPDFLCLRGQGLSFAHFSLQEWLTQKSDQGYWRADLFAVRVPEGASRIRGWAMKCVSNGTAHTYDYLLRHLASHLHPGPERQDIYADLLLKRFEWSQARLNLSGVAGLLEDVRHLPELPDAGLFRALMGQAEPALRYDAAQWCLQVLGRLGVGKENIGLSDLALSAARSAASLGLRPLTRSLRWRAAQQRQWEGGAPLVVLPDGRIAYARGDCVCICDPGGEPQVLAGHTQEVRALAALPGGRLASGGADSSVRIWDLASGASRVLEGHTSSVSTLTVLAGGRVASGSEDHSVRVWNLARDTYQALEGHTNGVRALAVLPDGRVASGSSDGSVRIWDLATGTSEMHEHHIAAVNVLVVSHGRLVSGSDDHSVRVWDIARGASYELGRHTNWVIALAVLPDGRVISGGDQLVRIWDPRTGAAQELKGHTKAVSALAVLSDGRVISGSWDLSVRVWDLGSGTSDMLEGHTKGVSALAPLPDGRIVSGSWDNSVRVWDPAGRASQAPEGHTRAVSALAALADGRVVSGSLDHSVRIWDPGGRGSEMLAAPTDYVSALAVLPGGRMVSGSDDHAVRVWDLAGGDSRALTGHTGAVDALAVLSAGQVASGSRDCSVRVWDLAGGASRELRGHRSRITALAALSDGRVVSGSEDRSVRVWSPASGDCQVLAGHTGEVSALAVAPDGRVMSGSPDGSIHIWNLAGGDSQVLAGDTGAIRALAVLRDGSVVSGGGDGSVRVWSQELQLQETFIADAPIRRLTLTPAGLIVAGCQDGSVHFLRLQHA